MEGLTDVPPEENPDIHFPVLVGLLGHERGRVACWSITRPPMVPLMRNRYTAPSILTE